MSGTVEDTGAERRPANNSFFRRLCSDRESLMMSVKHSVAQATMSLGERVVCTAAIPVDVVSVKWSDRYRNGPYECRSRAPFREACRGI
jgi:hypothetical protein